MGCVAHEGATVIAFQQRTQKTLLNTGSTGSRRKRSHREQLAETDIFFVVVVWHSRKCIDRERVFLEQARIWWKQRANADSADLHSTDHPRSIPCFYRFMVKVSTSSTGGSQPESYR